MQDTCINHSNYVLYWIESLFSNSTFWHVCVFVVERAFYITMHSHSLIFCLAMFARCDQMSKAQFGHLCGLLSWHSIELFFLFVQSANNTYSNVNVNVNASPYTHTHTDTFNVHTLTFKCQTSKYTHTKTRAQALTIYDPRQRFKLTTFDIDDIH